MIKRTFVCSMNSGDEMARALGDKNGSSKSTLNYNFAITIDWKLAIRE